MTHLLNPDEVKKRRTVKNTTPSEQKQTEAIESDINSISNKAGFAKVNYETMGRFDIPITLYFDDYTYEHINSFALVTEEDILETIITVLDDIVQSDTPVQVQNMLLQEFLETMIAIKSHYETPFHTHRWVCDCQSGKIESEIQTNESIIDLRTLEFKSIFESDEYLKEISKQSFEKMSKEEWKTYLINKYKNNPIANVDDYTIEDELKNLQVSEPIGQMINDDIYRFRFMRISDILQAQKYIHRKYLFEEKKQSVKRPRKENEPMAEYKAEQEERHKKMEKQKAQDLMLAAKASTIISVNGTTIDKLSEKIEYMKKIKRSSTLEFEDFLNKLDFGIKNEFDFECPLCHKVDRRSLRQEFIPFEFIPMSDDSKDSHRQSISSSIFIGA